MSLPKIRPPASCLSATACRSFPGKAFALIVLSTKRSHLMAKAVSKSNAIVGKASRFRALARTAHSVIKHQKTANSAKRFNKILLNCAARDRFFTTRVVETAQIILGPILIRARA